MDYAKQIISEIELHSVKGIVNCFNNGVNPNDKHNNLPLIYELTSEYTRSPRFKECVKIFVNYGVEFDDKALLAVLLDDALMLENEIIKERSTISFPRSLRCAYTPLLDATLLHICAEFNHVSCAQVLYRYGADVNAKAGVDENGFGGQTPIFHTVNQNGNQSVDMMNFLLSQNADLHLTVKGIVWGKGYEWETFIPCINPLSYAMMGLLPQIHRDEKTIAEIVSILLKHKYTIDYMPTNSPNKYLQH